MMDKYRIGRIEGPWKNFVPPIQGGIFRTDAADDGIETLLPEVETTDETRPSSHSGSRSPSPLFEPPAVRLRQTGAAPPRPASVSSMSSLDEPNDRDAASFLDARTRQEIRLDMDKYPDLDGATQRVIVEKYRLLGERVRAEGLYQCNYGAYGWEVARYSLLFGLMLLFLRWKWYALSGVFMGFFWHQLVFTAHDAGHMGITHNFHGDTVIGIIIADFLGGLSLGWWKRSHNVHHIVTNTPGHDPDIEHMPFFATSHRFLQSLRSSYDDHVMEYDAVAKICLPYQSWSYYPILCFARFYLYKLSWEHLIFDLGPKKGVARWHRWLEMTGQVFFWCWFGYGILYKSIDSNVGRVLFVFLSHAVTMPLHVQITLSHFAMSTADLGPQESFPQKMLRTTMDVDCPAWLDFFHGGLQFQAVHHLFPRVPRHNLRRTQALVQDFCDDVGIPYALYGFVDGNKQVLGRLADVARQVTILAECQRVLAASGDPLHAHHH